HDPRRTDEAIDKEMEALRQSLQAAGVSLMVFAAAEGQELHLTGTGQPDTRRGPEITAKLTSPPDLTQRSVLLGISSQALFDRIPRPLGADRIQALRATDKAQVLEIAAAASPSLIVLESDLTGDGISTCEALRAGGIVPADVPIIVAAPREADRAVAGV